VIGGDEDGRVAARRQLDFLPDAGWRTLLEHDLTFHVCMSPAWYNAAPVKSGQRDIEGRFYWAISLARPAWCAVIVKAAVRRQASRVDCRLE
jgi:hypothetical protein